MASIVFLTSNKNKFYEAKNILGPDITLLEEPIHLVETQSTSVVDVAKDKIRIVYEKIRRPCFVEDTGLYIADLNNFPGALAKYFLHHLQNSGVCRIAAGSQAYAETVVVYYDTKKTWSFFGRIDGHIAKKPRGEGFGFGWDPIFIPKGYTKTFAEMNNNEKDAISMRAKALAKLKKHLQENS